MVAERSPDTARVLVTRPAGDASDALCAAVKAAGHDAYRQPLLVLNALPQLPAAQRQKVLDLDLYQHIIFISANAVHFGMTLIEDHWPQLPVDIHWYAIGSATAARLERYGIDAVTADSPMTSESLLAVSQLQDVRDQRVLIIKGEGGRNMLRQELTRRGASVDELPCYTRNLPDLPPGALAAMLIRWDIDVILLSSGEGLANMQVLLSPLETTKLKHLGLIVPSQRVADIARTAGFEHVVTAENASDLAMLRALQEWRRGTGE